MRCASTRARAVASTGWSRRWLRWATRAPRWSAAGRDGGARRPGRRLPVQRRPPRARGVLRRRRRLHPRRSRRPTSARTRRSRPSRSTRPGSWCSTPRPRTTARALAGRVPPLARPARAAGRGHRASTAWSRSSPRSTRRPPSSRTSCRPTPSWWCSTRRGWSTPQPTCATEAAELLVAGWLSGSDGSGADRVDEAALDLLFGGADSPADRAGFADWDRVVARVKGGSVELTPFASHATDVTVRGRGWDSYRGDVTAAAQPCASSPPQGTAIVLTTQGTGPAHRLAEVFRGEDLAPRVLDRVPADQDGDGAIVIVPSSLAEGFASDELGLAVLGEHDLFGPRRSARGRRLPTQPRRRPDRPRPGARRPRRARHPRHRPLRGHRHPGAARRRDRRRRHHRAS